MASHQWLTYPDSDDNNNFSGSPPQNKHWDIDPPEYSHDWDCLTVHYFCPLPKFISYLNLNLKSEPKDGWNVSFVSSHNGSVPHTKSPFSAFYHFFLIGVQGIVASC
jgi:hypothetical protein